MKATYPNRNIIKSETLTLVVSKEEKEKIKNAANDMGVTMSSFIRLVLNDYVKKHGG